MTKRKSAKGKRPNGGRRNNTLDLTNFGQSNRRRIVASFQRDLSTTSTISLTIGRKATGTQDNPLIESWFGNDLNGWPLESIRVVSLKVVFDCRGVGADSFNARPRVGAFMSGDILSAIDEAKVESNIECFGGHSVSPNGQKTVNVRIGPEFSLGRFGETGANSLVIYSRGFRGVARVIVTYEVTGFPATRVII